MRIGMPSVSQRPRQPHETEGRVEATGTGATVLALHEGLYRMSNVRYQKGTAAPLPREWLDTVAPAIRAVSGLVFIAWSWVSTLLIVGTLLAPVLPGATIAGIPDRALVAIGFAFL